MVLRRLLGAHRLDAGLYQGYKTWRDQQGYPKKTGGTRLYRHREPKHIFGNVFVTTVLNALHAKNLTLTKASDYLDRLKIEDLRKLEQFYLQPDHASL